MANFYEELRGSLPAEARASFDAARSRREQRELLLLQFGEVLGEQFDGAPEPVDLTGEVGFVEPVVVLDQAAVGPGSAAEPLDLNKGVVQNNSPSGSGLTTGMVDVPVSTVGETAPGRVKTSSGATGSTRLVTEASMPTQITSPAGCR